MSLVAGTLAGFIGGAVSTYVFHRPSLNKEGVRVLASGGLQGNVLAVASFILSSTAYVYVSRNISDKKEKEKWAPRILFITFVACAIAVPVAAKTLTHRLGTPTEAFVNFAVSLASMTVGYIMLTD